MRSTVVKWAVAGISLIAFACSSSTGTGSGFTVPTTSPTGTGDDMGTGNGDDGGGGTVTIGGSSNTDGGHLTVVTPPPADGGVMITVNPNCNTANAAATRKPVNLVVVLDQSYSMGDATKSGSTPIGWTTRWAPVTQALESFLEDSGSTGISASLALFPLGAPNSAAGIDDNAPMCTADYSTPLVGLTSLPVDSTNDPFANAIDPSQHPGVGPLSTQYNPHGLASDTPTGEALTGAYNYVASLQANDTSGAVYAVVLVTDGDPCGCNYGNACPSVGGSSADANAATAAQAIAQNIIAPEYASANIPTYVIGVGPDGMNLDAFASAGGTSKAINVSTGTASSTSSQLIAALDTIRTNAISCTYPIPPATNGQTYDLEQVAVEYTAADGTTSVLPYDPNCTNDGWHFDSLSAPTQVLLCGSTCTMLKADTQAAVDVVFSCDVTTVIPGYDGGVTVR